MYNFKDLIGIPFVDGGRDPNTGLDCWGLIIVAAKRLGIEIPDYQIQCFDTKNIVKQVYRDKKDWVKINEPVEGCIIGMARSTSFPDSINHFGIYIGQRYFLHSVEKSGVICTKINNPLFKNSIKGFYLCKNQ